MTSEAIMLAAAGVVAGGILTWYFAWRYYKKQKREAAEEVAELTRQAGEQTKKLDSLKEQVGKVVAYLDGLPKSTGPVRTSFDLGLAAMEVHKWDRAVGHFREAVKFASGTQLVALYNLIGLCYYTSHRRDDALQAYEESRRLAVDFGDKQGEAGALGNMGLVYQDMHVPDKALEKAERARLIMHDIGDWRGEASAIGNIATVYHDRGMWDQALKFHQDALAIDLQNGDKQDVAFDIGNIGSVLGSRGEHAEATAKFIEALSLLGDTAARDIRDRLRYCLRLSLRNLHRAGFVAACVKAGLTNTEAAKLADSLARSD